MTRIDFFIGLLPRYKLNLIVTLTNAELRRKMYPAATRWEIIILRGSNFNHAL